MSLRNASVSGSFYPSSKDEIKRYIEYFSKDLKDIEIPINPKALIVPHAGYIYSGFTANLAYYLSQKKQYKRIIVIGPSHKVYIEGASVCLSDEYVTPLGNLKIDSNYAKGLKEKYGFLYYQPVAHEEHSTETQMPFIKHYFPSTEVVEIVYGRLDYQKLSDLIMQCLSDEENLVVISTDLSHFYSLEEANALDDICLRAIANKDMNQFEQGCEACGIIGVKAVVDVALKRNLKTELLNYCTSYDRSQDKSSVVGYCSFMIGE